jgi:hypothetical protein
MPPQTPKIMSSRDIRAIGSRLAEYAHRCNELANEMDRVGVADVNVKTYAAWARAIKELSRFFSTLEPSIEVELELRGAYHSETPIKRPVKKSPKRLAKKKRKS